MEIIYKIDDFPNPGDRDVYRGIQEINKGNYQEAQKYFEKGSNYDNEYASLFNALHYYTGFGFAKRDPSKAMNILKTIALEWNNPVAQYLVGTMYLQGDKGISPNGKHAMEWLLLAAENNWADAMVLVGVGYLAGKIFEQDSGKALSWFQKVAQKDKSITEPIKDDILYLFENKELELRMNTENDKFIKTIIDASILPPVHYIDPVDDFITDDWGEQLYVIFWSLLTNKKSRGVVPSQLFIGDMYRYTFPKYVSKSTFFFKRAAKNGSGEACMILGSVYEFGINKLKDSVKALKWYKKALELHGDIDAAYRIGVVLYNAKYVDCNSKVIPNYSKFRVDDSVHGSSRINIGDANENGTDIVHQYYTLARQFYENAFDRGEVSAALVVSRFYSEGLGVKKNKKKADEWKLKAMFRKSTVEQAPPNLLGSTPMLN